MVTVMAFLARRSKTFIIVLGFALVIVLGGIDYLSGSEISFSIFYLLPISLVAWFVGRWAGVVISGLAAASWLVADLSTGHFYSHSAIPFWNALVRGSFFLTVTFALSALRAYQRKQESMMHFIVHDLRAPLSVILTGLEVLRGNGAPSLDETQQMIVRNSVNSGHRMLALINSLLDLSRLENGKMPLHIQTVSVKELIESSLEQLNLWAKRNQVTLLMQLHTEVEIVQADYELTLRVLVNLLSNAIKFSPPGSTVTVRVAQKPGMLAFSVIDQGPGIPKEWADKAFEKFVQVEALQTKVQVGSGLGLNFCQLAVKAQGGHIRLESERGKGTQVTLTLPT